MNARSDQTVTYSNAFDLIKEYWLTSDGTVRCPECDMQQHDVTVEERNNFNEPTSYTLYRQCEYCDYYDKIYFDELDEW